MKLLETARRWASCSIAIAAGSVHAVSLTNSPYSESFDSMGTTGTTLPTDWSRWISEGGSNSTWVSSITANGATLSVQSMIVNANALTAVTTPSGTANGSFNAALSASATADRVLATSPTTVAGVASQVLLTNDTGSVLTGLTVAFDTVRFTSVATANELPGYWLFYSTDNSTWVNAGPNPSITTVPNTVGATNTSVSFSFASAVATGASLRLRWVDDNAGQTSPDQIIGLNNVVITAVPEPGVLAMMLAGIAAVGFVAARRRSAPLG